MKKLIKWAAASAAAVLMVSSLSFAQTPSTAPANSSGTVTPTSTDVSSSPAGTNAATPVDTTTSPSSSSTTTVTPVGGTKSAPATTTVTPMGRSTTTVTVVKTVPGFKVCYHPVQRHVEGSRIVQRCGPYGCRDFRITRDFYVTTYADCHIAKSCESFRTYGWYPNRMEARDARDRCQHTVNGSMPHEWRITNW